MKEKRREKESFVRETVHTVQTETKKALLTWISQNNSSKPSVEIVTKNKLFPGPHLIHVSILVLIYSLKKTLEL